MKRLTFLFILIFQSFAFAESKSCQEILNPNLYSRLSYQYQKEGVSLDAEKKAHEQSETSFISMFWNTFNNVSDFYDSFLSRKHIDRISESGQHVTEVVDVTTWKDMAEAYDFIESIPTDRLRLDFNTVLKSHKIFNASQKKWQAYLARVFPGLSGYFFEPGKLKKRRNGFLFSNATKEQVANILANHEELKKRGALPSNLSTEEDNELELQFIDFKHRFWVGLGKKIGKFKHLSRKDAEFGYVYYSSGKASEKALKHLINWTNTHLKRLKDDPNSQGPDVIEVATIFSRTFVYIHPFIDGNGRTARLWRDKILSSFGLVYPKTINLEHDLDLTAEQHISLTRKAIAYRNIDVSNRYSQAPTVVSGGVGTNLKPDLITKNEDLVTQGVPTSRKQIFEIGNSNFTREFVIKQDGFFYTNKGVPYTIIESEEGVNIIPIATMSYYLFSHGGVPVVTPVSENNEDEIDVLTPARYRQVNTIHEEFTNLNLKYARKILEDKKIGRDINVVRYSTSIMGANNNGQYYFHGWEQPLIEQLLTFDEDPKEWPLFTLYRMQSGGTIEFENQFSYGANNFNIENVLASALMTDFDLRVLDKQLRIHKPEWHKEFETKILEARRKVHTAFRTVLSDRAESLNNIFEKDADQQTEFSKEAHEFLRKTPFLRVFYEYFKRTPFWYASFDESLEKTDQDSVTVIRSSSFFRGKKIGLVSEKTIQDLILSIPGLKKLFKNLLQEVTLAETDYDGEFQDKPNFESKIAYKKILEILKKLKINTKELRLGLNTLVHGWLVSPYKNRGFEKEYEREFIKMILHIGDQKPQFGISTTANTTTVVSRMNHVSFANSEDPMIQIFSSPLDSIVRAKPSSFESEYEMWLKKPFWALADKFRKNKRFLLEIFGPDLLPPVTQNPKEIEEEKELPNNVVYTEDGKVPQEATDFLNNFKVTTGENERFEGERRYGNIGYEDGYEPGFYEGDGDYDHMPHPDYAGDYEGQGSPPLNSSDGYE